MTEVNLKIEQSCRYCKFSISITDIKTGDQTVMPEVIIQLNKAAENVLMDHINQAHKDRFSEPEFIKPSPIDKGDLY